MATRQEKLAKAMEVLESLQDYGVIAVRASNLSKTYRKRLQKNDFLQ